MNVQDDLFSSDKTALAGDTTYNEHLCPLFCLITSSKCSIDEGLDIISKSKRQAAREGKSLGLYLDEETEVQGEGTAHQRSWRSRMPAFASLRPLHLEGLEPEPSPPSATTSQDTQLVVLQSHPPCCLEPILSRAHPEPHQAAVFPLGRGEPPGGRAMQKYSISFFI